jgi:hypothetical protein
VGSAKRRYGRLSKGLSTGEPFSEAIANHKLDMVKNSPPQVQFHLHMASGSAWSTLRSGGLNTPPEELASNHKVIVEGRWHVVGVKDAEPEPHQAFPGPRGQIAAKYPNQPYPSDAAHVAKARRRMLGQPCNAFGITPLMIFRPIA